MSSPCPSPLPRPVEQTDKSTTCPPPDGPCHQKPGRSPKLWAGAGAGVRAGAAKGVTGHRRGWGLGRGPGRCVGQGPEEGGAMEGAWRVQGGALGGGVARAGRGRT